MEPKYSLENLMWFMLNLQQRVNFNCKRFRIINLNLN